MKTSEVKHYTKLFSPIAFLALCIWFIDSGNVPLLPDRMEWPFFINLIFIIVLFAGPIFALWVGVLWANRQPDERDHRD